MAKLTLQQVFPGAVVVDDLTDLPASIDPAEPALLLPWSMFVSAGMNVLASLEDPDKVIISLLKLAEPAYTTDGTEEPAISFDKPRYGYDSDRNGKPADTFSYGVVAYQGKDNPTLDPDTIKSGL